MLSNEFKKTVKSPYGTRQHPLFMRTEGPDSNRKRALRESLITLSYFPILRYVTTFVALNSSKQRWIVSKKHCIMARYVLH